MLALGGGFGFGLPDSGGLVWADAMVIPSTAEHTVNAERLMNFYYDPEVAARLAAWIQYVCPVEGAQEAMASVDPSLVNDPWIFPSPQILDAAATVQGMTMARTEDLDRRFDTVVNG